MSGTRYQEHILQGKANKYILKVLEDGGRTLAKLVLGKVDLSNAKKVTFLSEDIDVEMIDDFEDGVLASAELTRNWLARKIKRFLGLDTNHLVIFEHACAKRSDPWLKKCPVPPVFYNDEVYFALYSTEAGNLKRIKTTVGTAESAWLLIGFMSSLPASHLPLPNNLDANTIRLLAKRTEQIVTSSFDGEGYIICLLY